MEKLGLSKNDSLLQLAELLKRSDVNNPDDTYTLEPDDPDEEILKYRRSKMSLGDGGGGSDRDGNQDAGGTLQQKVLHRTKISDSVNDLVDLAKKFSAQKSNLVDIDEEGPPVEPVNLGSNILPRSHSHECELTELALSTAHGKTYIKSPIPTYPTDSPENINSSCNLGDLGEDISPINMATDDPELIYKPHLSPSREEIHRLEIEAQHDHQLEQKSFGLSNFKKDSMTKNDSMVNLVALANQTAKALKLKQQNRSTNVPAEINSAQRESPLSSNPSMSSSNSSKPMMASSMSKPPVSSTEISPMKSDVSSEYENNNSNNNNNDNNNSRMTIESASTDTTISTIKILPPSSRLVTAPASAFPDSIQITGTTKDGTVREKVLSSSVGKEQAIIFSGMGLVSVDLSQLSQHPDVALSILEVSLAANNLTTVDLSPLGLCSNLKALMLNGNELSSIDLSPLENSQQLERLWLHNNKLQNIDLTPLQGCPSFRSLYLDCNKLDAENSLDLTPLAHCKLLRSVRLSGNKLGGMLNITPLLSCVNLSIFDILASVKTKANQNEFSINQQLPPAFRKRVSLITWVSEIKSTSQPNDKQKAGATTTECNGDSNKSAVQIKTLMLNFKVSSYYTTQGLLKKENFECTNVADFLYAKGSLEEYDLVMLQVRPETIDVCLKTVEEIRMLSKEIPLCLLTQNTANEFGGKSLRLGADRLFQEPLNHRDALILKELTKKKSRTKSPTSRLTTTDAPKSPKPQQAQTPTSPGKAVANQERKADLLRELPAIKRLRQSPDIVRSPSPGGVGGAVRNKMERAALQKLFVRYGGFASEAEFSPMATLCGLPACAAGCLFRAVLSCSASPNDTKIALQDFSDFWRTKFENYDAEGRLFNALQLNKENGVRAETIAKVARALLGVTRPREFNEEEADGVSKCVLFGLSGLHTNKKLFSEKKLRSVKFCMRLLGAEAGVFDGILATLRADRFKFIRSMFLTAASKVNCENDNGDFMYVTREALKQFCSERKLITPGAIDAIFGVYVENGKMTLGEFTRFWMAQENCGSDSSLEYWYMVIDTDMDGRLSAQDAFHFYREKEALHRKDGLFLAHFMDYWVSLLDMLGLRKDCITLQELRRLSEKARKFFIQALIYSDDENAIIDIRRTVSAATANAGEGGVPAVVLGM